MSSRIPRADTGVSVSFIASVVIHLAVLSLFAWYGRMFPPQIAIQETYYVDVVSLPVNDPASGSPAQLPAAAVAPPLPAPESPMTEPLPPSRALPKKITKTIKPASPQKPEATDSYFAERMARIERSTEDRREEAVLAKLRSKVKAADKSKKGASEVGGALSGSRYADYIKSRLEDALKVTSSYTTNNPEVAVRLTIAPTGRILRLQIERSSGDAAFELAVRRAIDLAGEKLPAPPGHTVYENGFVFRPKSISSGASY